MEDEKFCRRGRGRFFVGEGNQMQNDFDHLTLGDAKSIVLELIIMD